MSLFNKKEALCELERITDSLNNNLSILKHQYKTSPEHTQLLLKQITDFHKAGLEKILDEFSARSVIRRIFASGIMTLYLGLAAVTAVTSFFSAAKAAFLFKLIQELTIAFVTVTVFYYGKDTINSGIEKWKK